MHLLSKHVGFKLAEPLLAQLSYHNYLSLYTQMKFHQLGLKRRKLN